MPGAHPPPPLLDVLPPPELELLAPPELELLPPPELEVLPPPLPEVLPLPELELPAPELEVLPPPELEVLPPPELEVLPPPDPEPLPDVDPPPDPEPDPEPELPPSPASLRSSPMGSAAPLQAASSGRSTIAVRSEKDWSTERVGVGMPAYWPEAGRPWIESAGGSQTARSRPTSGDDGCAWMNACAAPVEPTMQSASARAPSRSCASVPDG
jgi:hypothetical protein